MEEDLLSRAPRVEDPKAVAALLDPRLRELVLSLARQPRSLGELAAETGQDLKQLHHHVTRLCRLGLVEVAGEQRRPGRPIKLYRATSAAFLVPHGAAPGLMTEDLARELRESLAAEARKSDGGVVFGLDRHGRSVTRGARGTRPAQAMESWSVLLLTPEERTALTAELNAVVSRFAGRTEGPGQPYLVHAAAAPKRDLVS
jgi:hypothetical protein